MTGIGTQHPLDRLQRLAKATSADGSVVHAGGLWWLNVAPSWCCVGRRLSDEAVDDVERRLARRRGNVGGLDVAVAAAGGK